MAKQKLTIIITDYSNSPGPRYCYQGDDSGEDFYHNLLNKTFKIALDNDQILEINLDGPDGYASSFLDEAFGNLVFDFGIEKVRNHVKIISKEEPEWIDMLEKETYIQWEQRRNESLVPKKTIEHEPWWKFINNSIEQKVWLAKS